MYVRMDMRMHMCMCVKFCLCEALSSQGVTGHLTHICFNSPQYANEYTDHIFWIFPRGQGVHKPYFLVFPQVPGGT